MKFATRLFLLIFLVNGITALVSTSIFLRSARQSAQEELQRSMSLVVTVAAARYEGYIDRATAVLDTVVTDSDVRNFFSDHPILRHYSRQAASQRLARLIESNPSIGDMVVASNSERASMMGCSVSNRSDLGSFMVSCDEERAFKVLSRQAGSQVRADVLVDLQRYVDTQVAPLLRDAARFLLVHRDGGVLAVTGGSPSEGRSWLLEHDIGVPTTAGILYRSADHHTMSRRHGEVAELAGALRDLNARVVGSTEELDTMVRQRTAVIEEQKSELVKLNERLQEMASRDSLTGLLNRRAFEEQAANVFALARREERGLGVAMVDIDFFKAVNDEHGHQAGDEALRIIASLLQEHFRRDSDLIGRYGGEEFVVVTTATRVDAEFARVLEEFRTTVAAQAIEAEGRRITLTVSCGAVEIAFAPLACLTRIPVLR